MRKWTYVLSFCFGVVNDAKRLDTHLFRAVMDFQNTHSLKDYKEKNISI